MTIAQMSFPDAVDGSLLARRATKVAVAALANKIPRMPWAIMARGERYTEPVALAMGFDAGLLAFAMVHCACSSPLFAEASACIVCSPRPLPFSPCSGFYRRRNLTHLRRSTAAL